MSAGYLFQVDWQRPPVSPVLTLHARMTVADGRQFDETTQVKVAPSGQLPPAIARDLNNEPGDWTAQTTAGALSDRRVSPAAGRATVRSTDLADDRRSGEPLLPPRIRPSSGAGHAAPPTQTSDRWTEATIPTLR